MASFRSRKRKGGTFYSVYFKLDGVQFERAAGKSRGFAKRWAARLTEQELRRKAGFPEVEGPFRSTLTVAALRDLDLEDARLSGREVASRRRRWSVITESLDDNARLDQVSGPVAEAFRTDRLRLASPATVNRDLSVLSAAWQLAIRRGEAVENPWKRIPRAAEKANRRKPIVLDEAASERLIRLAWERAAGAHHALEAWQSAAIVEILFLTASRLSQVCRLRKDQIAGSDLLFEPQKGGRDRVFDMDSEEPGEKRLGELVREAARRSSSATWIFPSVRARGKPRGNIRKFWTGLLEDAELVAVRRHDLRHSSTTLAAYRGETIPELQERAGHASPRMVSDVYSHVHRRRIRPMVPGQLRDSHTPGKGGKGANGASEKSNVSAGAGGARGRPGSS